MRKNTRRHRFVEYFWWFNCRISPQLKTIMLSTVLVTIKQADVFTMKRKMNYSTLKTTISYAKFSYIPLHVRKCDVITLCEIHTRHVASVGAIVCTFSLYELNSTQVLQP